MKLRIRYENELQTLHLNAEDTEKLWISLSLEGEGLSAEERETKIQEAFDEQYNHPEYNNWHKFNRHTGKSKAKPGKDETEDDFNDGEPLLKEVFDDTPFWADELKRKKEAEYEDVCQWVRATLGKKKNWADAFIAVRLDEMSVNDYAASIGVSDASIVSKYLARAEKKLKEFYSKRQK